MFNISRVQPGDSPSAADWNAMLDALDTLHDQISNVPSYGFPFEIEIYELTSDPANDADWGIWKANGKPVHLKYTSETEGDVVTEDDYPEEEIWFPCPADGSDPGVVTDERVTTIIVDGKRIVIGGGGAAINSKVISSATHAAVTTATASFSVSSCTVVEPGIGSDSSGSVTVYNVFAWAIDENALIWAKWNQATSHYELFQAKCPAA